MKKEEYERIDVTREKWLFVDDIEYIELKNGLRVNINNSMKVNFSKNILIKYGEKSLFGNKINKYSYYNANTVLIEVSSEYKAPTRDFILVSTADNRVIFETLILKATYSENRIVINTYDSIGMNSLKYLSYYNVFDKNEDSYVRPSTGEYFNLINLSEPVEIKIKDIKKIKYKKKW